MSWIASCQHRGLTRDHRPASGLAVAAVMVVVSISASRFIVPTLYRHDWHVNFLTNRLRGGRRCGPKHARRSPLRLLLLPIWRHSAPVCRLLRNATLSPRNTSDTDCIAHITGGVIV